MIKSLGFFFMFFFKTTCTISLINNDYSRLLDLKNKENILKKNLMIVQEQKRKILNDNPLSIGIIGFGNYGQFLAKRFKKQGHIISALSRTNYSNLASLMDVNYYYYTRPQLHDFFQQENLDVILISTSILSFEHVIEDIYHYLNNKSFLVVDVLSVKMHPKSILLKKIPFSCDILCTHPMFGPESGKNSWENLNLVYDLVEKRNKNKIRTERFLSIFDTEGCNMINMSSEEHDLNSANSQFSTHLVGRVLDELHLRTTEIDTVSYKNMIELKDSVSNDSFDLFYGLYKYNPNSLKTLLLLKKAIIDLEFKLLEYEETDLGIEGWKLYN